MSLVARHLEEQGIPTVVFGCARDIVEHCGVPRFVFTDFPAHCPGHDLRRRLETASVLDAVAVP